ncbi:MAG: ATP synthase F1 subunit delta [Chloroflexota bacterium]|nr:ATP synthase F1 subunit delta [Chloroflexota bacterium]
MARGPTARRYAQALFDLAREQGETEQWLDQLRHAAERLTEPAAALYLGVPRVPTEDKLALVLQALSGAHPLVVNAVSLLVQRGAAASLPQVAQVYGGLLDESMGRARASITSAEALSRAQQGKLSGLLETMLKKEIVLDAAVDSAVIGGVVVRVGDQVIDGSVRTRLDGLRRRLAQGPSAA